MIAHLVRQVIAVLALMAGRSDGLAALEVNRRALFDSFFALGLALPFLLPGWLDFIRLSGGSLSVAHLPRFALVDVLAWLVPMGLVWFVARLIDIEDRMMAWAIAYNWTSLVFAIAFMPLAFVPGGIWAAGGSGLVLVLFGATLFFAWRVQHAVLGREGRKTFIVFMTSVLSALLIVVSLQEALGLVPPIQP